MVAAALQIILLPLLLLEQLAVVVIGTLWLAIAAIKPGLLFIESGRPRWGASSLWLLFFAAASSIGRKDTGVSFEFLILPSLGYLIWLIVLIRELASCGYFLLLRRTSIPRFNPSDLGRSFVLGGLLLYGALPGSALAIGVLNGLGDFWQSVNNICVTLQLALVWRIGVVSLGGRFMGTGPPKSLLAYGILVAYAIAALLASSLMVKAIGPLFFVHQSRIIEAGPFALSLVLLTLLSDANLGQEAPRAREAQDG